MSAETPLALLVIEPDPLARDLACVALQSLAPQTAVTAVPDGLEALAQVDTVRPQAVIVSLLLPRLSGLETIRQLRRRLPAGCPILAVSALALPDVVRQAGAAGAGDFVVRPDAASHLVERVRQALARTEQAEARPAAR